MKIKRMHLAKLIEVFNKIKSSDHINIKTALILYKNSKKIEEELKFIQEELPKLVSDATRNFELKKQELMKECCVKDDDGNPVKQPDGGYSFSQEGFMEFQNRLAKYLEELDEDTRYKIEKEMIDIKNFTEEEIEIDLEPFKEDMLPDNVLNYSDISFLFDCGCTLG